MAKLQEQWQSFDQAIIPKNAPPIQRQEMRRAFYAGAFAMLNISKQLGDEDIDMDAGVAVLEGVEQEIQQFFSRVGIDC